MWVRVSLPRFGVGRMEVLGARRFFREGSSSEQVEAGGGLRETGVREGGVCKGMGMRGASESSWWQGGSR